MLHEALRQRAERALLDLLLAQPSLADTGPRRAGGPLIARPPREIGEKVVDITDRVASFAWLIHRGPTVLSTVSLVSDCLFCKIVAGDVPSMKVLETERTYAFRDISPAAPTHVLVIPKEHVVDNAHELGDGHGDVLAELFTSAQEVARSEGIDARGYRLVFNVGDDASNSVPHLHLHVIGGRRLGWPPG